jgi:serine/alanine adding enzyme
VPLSAAAARAGAARVEVLADDAAGWDRYVDGAEHATFCHLAGWREVFADALGHESRYLVARDGEGRWLGALPLVRVRSRIFGHHLVSLPFLNYGGPVGTPEATALLARRAQEEARRLGADLLELRCRHATDTDLRPSDRKLAVVLELPGTAEELWNGTLRAKLRSQVRRPQKAGMEARFGHDQLLPFYEVFRRNMRDLGTPVLPRRFFERISDAFGDRAVFGAVYRQGVPVAAGAGFVWRDEFEMTWASSLREHGAEAPNMLLYHATMVEAIGRGARRFNFGRCTPGSGTHRFKLQWGGVDVPLPWCTWSPRGLASTPTPDGPLYRTAVRLWQRLPLAVASRLGPVLARGIP